MYEHTERGVIWRYSPRVARGVLVFDLSREGWLTGYDWVKPLSCVRGIFELSLTVSHPRFLVLVRWSVINCCCVHFQCSGGILNGFYASLLFQCFRPHCWYPTEGNLYSLESSPAVLYFCSLYPRHDSSPAVSPLNLTLLVTGSIWKTFSLLCLLLWCPSPLHLSLTLSLGCER